MPPTKQSLNEIALSLFAESKGILAADESVNTLGKRFEKVGVENTEENRRAYREMLFTTPQLSEFISGIILFEETLRQFTKGSVVNFVKVIQDAGMIPGIKVDAGTMLMPRSLVENLTLGLEDLPARLREYADLGLKFAKWRAVIHIGEGMPTESNLKQNAKDLAQYAKLCQEVGIVPIVEPEVLMDGSHGIDKCIEASTKTLNSVFAELSASKVATDGLILKFNMITPGVSSPEKKSPGEIATTTVEFLKKTVPSNLPGVVFLSGGQSERDATRNLAAICDIGMDPQKLTFSYGRALQDTALMTWAGMFENTGKAQFELYHRAQLNSLAVQGLYDEEMEEVSPA